VLVPESALKIERVAVAPSRGDVAPELALTLAMSIGATDSMLRGECNSVSRVMAGAAMACSVGDGPGVPSELRLDGEGEAASLITREIGEFGPSRISIDNRRRGDGGLAP